MNRFSVGDLRGFDARVDQQGRPAFGRGARPHSATATLSGVPAESSNGAETGSVFTASWIGLLPLAPSALNRSRLGILGPKRRCCRSGCSGCPYGGRSRPALEPAEPLE